MTEPSGRDAAVEERSSSKSQPVPPALPAALWIASAAHLLVLLAAATDAVPRTTIIAAAIACSVIAIAALCELAPSAGPVRRALATLTGGHVLAAAVIAAGIAPRAPASLPLIGLASAAALGLASLAAARHAPTVNRQAPPLAMAPRVGAIALLVHALIQHWAVSETALSTPLRLAILLSIAALGVALLASLSIIALRKRPRWALAGLLAWTIGWLANAADTSSLIHWSLGGVYPMGPDQLLPLNPELVRILATAGGLAIGAALVAAIRDVRARHSAIVLLAGYAAFGWIAAGTEYKIGLATDFPTIAALRKQRGLADAITAFALAGVLWVHWRRSAASDPSRASTWERES